MIMMPSYNPPKRANSPKGLRRVGLMLSLTLVSCFATTHGQTSEEKTLVFGIVPQQSATSLDQVWVPMMAHLSEQTGVKIAFATAKDIPSFEACLAKGAYDLAYMNPYHFTVFNQASGYKAFARQANKKLKGIIVVPKSSDYQSLDELNKKEIAFPSPAAFGASVIPRAEMKQRDMIVSPIYVRSHDSVYRSVASGLFPAGGGVMRTFGNIPDGLRDKLRILYKTDGYTPHAFAAQERVPSEVVQKITAKMTSMTIEKDAVLKPLGMKAFSAAKDADWDDVRSLNLTEKQTEIIKDDSLKCHSG
jgi:phosphonate transport system substrate-binding protein